MGITDLSADLSDDLSDEALVKSPWRSLVVAYETNQSEVRDLGRAEEGASVSEGWRDWPPGDLSKSDSTGTISQISSLEDRTH